jgi:hypothetical protein
MKEIPRMINNTYNEISLFKEYAISLLNSNLKNALKSTDKFKEYTSCKKYIKIYMQIVGNYIIKEFNSYVRAIELMMKDYKEIERKTMQDVGELFLQTQSITNFLNMKSLVTGGEPRGHTLMIQNLAKVVLDGAVNLG